jgi:release factor glutamine methyltransferase
MRGSSSKASVRGEAVVETRSGHRVSELLSRGGSGRWEDASFSDLQVLLARAIGKSREFLYAHPDRELSLSEYDLLEGFLARRLAGEPVAYITGEKEFYSLPFKVDRSVLIPRPETELLVDEVLARRPGSILDMGTGSGNIAIAVKYHLRDCSVIACDASAEALAAATTNAREILGAHDVRFVQSRFFEGLRRSGLERLEGPPDLTGALRFDLIVSNPPYIARGALGSLQREVRDYEPLLALDGGEDGLDAYRAILSGAREYLSPGGRVILETDPSVLAGLLRLAEEAGFALEKAVKDLQGMDRMVVIA